MSFGLLYPLCIYFYLIYVEYKFKNDLLDN